MNKQFCIYENGVYPVENIGTKEYVDINSNKYTEVTVSSPISRTTIIPKNDIFKSEKAARDELSKRPNAEYDLYRNKLLSKDDLIRFALTHDLTIPSAARKAFIVTAKELGIELNL